jgi:hypothetical protein
LKDTGKPGAVFGGQGAGTFPCHPVRLHCHRIFIAARIPYLKEFGARLGPAVPYALRLNGYADASAIMISKGGHDKDALSRPFDQ